MTAPEAQTPGGNRASADTKHSTASVPPADESGNEKTISTLSARLAIAGYAVHHLSSGGFLVCRWGLTRHCPDVRTLAGFAHQVGVR